MDDSLWLTIENLGYVYCEDIIDNKHRKCGLDTLCKGWSQQVVCKLLALSSLQEMTVELLVAM